MIWSLSKTSHDALHKLINSELNIILHTNLRHFAKFLKIACDEIEERQLVKVLCSLVCHFHHLLRIMDNMTHFKHPTFYSGNKLCVFYEQYKTNIEAWRPSVLQANIPGE